MEAAKFFPRCFPMMGDEFKICSRSSARGPCASENSMYPSHIAYGRAISAPEDALAIHPLAALTPAANW
jgi:hypothetical protein